MKTSKDWLKTDVNGELAPQHVNILIQKTTSLMMMILID